MMLLRRVNLRSSAGRMFLSGSSYDSLIQELNREMESVFGEPPATGINSSPTSLTKSRLTAERKFDAPVSYESQQGLSHVDNTGSTRMVDVSSKEDSKRVAVAGCRVLLGKKAYDLVAANQIAKGDVLNVAKIAGITAAKQTSSLIPLCHNIGLTHVCVDLSLCEKDFSVDIEGEVSTTGKTGVEMEAMTAASVAGLTVYDMCKAVAKDISITDIHLKYKSGGKSGTWFKN